MQLLEWNLRILMFFSNATWYRFIPLQSYISFLNVSLYQTSCFFLKMPYNFPLFTLLNNCKRLSDNRFRIFLWVWKMKCRFSGCSYKKLGFLFTPRSCILDKPFLGLLNYNFLQLNKTSWKTCSEKSEITRESRPCCSFAFANHFTQIGDVLKDCIFQ